MTRAAVLAVTVALALPAAAGALTRSEYNAQVNQICATTNAKSDALLRAFLRKQHKIGKRKARLNEPDSILTEEVRRLTNKRVRLFNAELAQLRAVPAAAGDEATVASWLALRQQEVDLGTRVRKRQLAYEKGAEKRSRTAKGRALQRKLDKRLEKLLLQAHDLEQRDSALATQLGATSCLPSAANGEAIGNLGNEV